MTSKEIAALPANTAGERLWQEIAVQVAEQNERQLELITQFKEMLQQFKTMLRPTTGGFIETPTTPERIEVIKDLTKKAQRIPLKENVQP